MKKTKYVCDSDDDMFYYGDKAIRYAMTPLFIRRMSDLLRYGGWSTACRGFG